MHGAWGWGAVLKAGPFFWQAVRREWNGCLVWVEGDAVDPLGRAGDWVAGSGEMDTQVCSDLSCEVDLRENGAWAPWSFDFKSLSEGNLSSASGKWCGVPLGNITPQTLHSSQRGEQGTPGFHRKECVRQQSSSEPSSRRAFGSKEPLWEWFTLEGTILYVWISLHSKKKKISGEDLTPLRNQKSGKPLIGAVKAAGVLEWSKGRGGNTRDQ